MTFNTHSYYDYIEKWYEEYYDHYYEHYYWPKHYGVFNVSNGTIFCPNTTHNHIINDARYVNNLNCTPSYNGTYPPSPYIFHPWWYEHIDTVFLIIFPIAILCTLISFVITCLFFNNLSRARKNAIAPNNVTVGLSTTCIVSYALYNIADVGALYFYAIDYNANMTLIFTATWNLFWCVSKSSMYGLYAYRYYTLMATSMHRYATNTRKGIICATLTIVIWCQFLLAGLRGFYECLFEQIEIDKMGRKQEIRSKLLLTGWVVMTLDFVLVFGLGYLILNHLLEITIAMGSIPDNADQMGRQRSSTKQMQLMGVSTRVALTSLIAMVSSLLNQFIWLYCMQTAYRLLWISWWWCVDNVINMLCIYLSMGFAKAHYAKICGKICKCHACFLVCIRKIVERKTGKNLKKHKQMASQHELHDTNMMQVPQTVLVPDSSAGMISFEVHDGADQDTSAKLRDETICVDCGELRWCTIFEEDGQFYCEECWRYYCDEQ